jgi:EmrB/QacA subfamily drug resistance transporter
MAGTIDADPHPRRWWALSALALMQFVIVIDNTVVNVALPSIQRELHFTTSGLSWVVNGYLLTAGGLLLLGGRLSDLRGRRRMFLAGTALFTFASLICGLSTGAAMLVTGRFLQGAGEALASPAALSLVAMLFPRAKDRAKALGIWGGLSGVGATAGVLLSGVLTDLLSWRWVFFVNLPCALVALLVVPRLVPASRPARAGRVDVAGALLATAGSIGLVYGMLASVRSGWTDAAVIVPLAAGAGAWILFVVVEARTPEPLVPLRFFANRTRVTANVVSVLMFGVLSAMFLQLTLYMQDVLGYRPLHTGLAYLPFCLFFVLGAAASFLLAARLGARLTLVAAFVVAAAGMLMASRLTVDGSWLYGLLPTMAVLATGFGMGLPALQTAALHGVSEADAGLGSGVQTSVQQMANALGIAVFLMVGLHHTSAALRGGASMAVATTEGYQLAFRVGAGVLLAGAVLVVVAMERSGQAPAGTSLPDRAAEPVPAEPLA